MINRILSTEIKRLATHYAVVVITGPRQSGKTTLCKSMFPDYFYVNLEDAQIREQIKNFPKQFLKKHLDGIVIDEAQQYPELFSFIQVLVDENPKSHFIITGSSNFALMESVTQSLAGRAAILTLLPLSLAELGQKKENPTDILLFNGGYPAVWGKQIPVQDVTKNYYITYIERNIRQSLKTNNISKFQIFIRLCAGRIGTEFNASALSNEVGVSAPTIHEWLSTLEASYILFRLPPFYRNVGKRLVKSPKLYFYDTGLICFLLGIEQLQHLENHPLRGAIFENLVLLEFVKNRFNSGKISNLFYYRDKSQREIDIVQEFGNEYHAYEVKSATSFNKNFLATLDYFKNIVGESLVMSQVIYDGEIDIDIPENGMVNFRRVLFR